MAEEVQDVLYPKLCDESLSTYEMSDHGFVRETYPNLMRSVEWRSLVINTGASHGTLQDIKLPEYSGGYTFEVAGARRTLLWRVTHDTLQLTEESTDVQLANAHLRLQFPDSPVLEGISAHQTPTSLVLLVATVASVHRLRMTLPAGGEGHCAAAAGSLLQQLTAQQLRQPDSMHVLQAQANAPAAHTAAAGLLPSGEAVFFLAGAAGGGQVVRYLSGGPGPLAAAHHLQPASVVGRLWGLFADPSQQRVDAALVLAPGEPAAPEPAVAAVCRDGRLRLWSVARRTALAELDLLEFLAERGPAGARRHGLRRRRGAGPPLLAAHLSLVGQQVFVLVRAAATRAAWSLQYVATVCAPDHALIDYALTEDALFALWSTAEAETQLCYYGLSGAADTAGWAEVVLEPPPPAVLPAAAEHLSQSYLRHIFHPGRFQLSTLQRAVSIRSRAACTETDARRLRAAVVAAVEADIQRSVPDSQSQLTADQFAELTQAAWESLYSACLQYHQADTKPMGLCADAVSGQVCVVRRAFVSYLRPAGLLERLWLSELTEPEDLCAPDDRLQADVARLVQCCRLLEGHLSEQLWAAVRQDLAHLVPPDAIAASVVAKVSDEPTAEFAAFRDLLAERLAAMDSLSAALARLVEFLQVDGGPLPPAEGAGPALSSRLGTGLLAATVRQTVRLRFSVAMSLVLLQTLALKLSERCRLQAEHESYIRARFLPESVIQVQAYFALLWLSETPAEAVSGDSQETARRQLAALTVQEAPPAAAAGVSVAAGRLSLLELFAAGAGGAAARAASGPAAGLHSLPEQAAALLRLVWPGGAHSQLPELLLASCQHAALREYVRLHSTWCDRNSASRCLLRGLALLNLGQPDKACDVLVASADSVGLDEPLLARLLRLDPAPDEPHSRLLVRYYLRVIRLLELHHLPDYVLELASAGIAVAEEADPNVATLWAIAFKYHLRLGHVHEAYAAMTGNPDASSRGDCLHQLVVTLHERRQLATLVQLPYVDMLGDVVAILENRARAADPLAPQFYDVLYAFHVARSNYRKAAAVMYEWARRLAGEPAGLARQARCYLACVNALQLVSAEYAWIVRPEVEERGATAVTVLTLDEIRREADLVAAQLRLREWEARDGGGAPPAGVSAVSAEELLARLVAARLYTDAVQVARAHRLSAQPVVRELAAALASGARDGSAWQWLGRCQLPAGAAAAGSAAEQTAALLRHVLADAPAGDTRLLRAAAERFLQLGRPLPAWLAADYERRSAAELGRLLLRAGQLEAAGRLLVRLLEALLGAGPERFGAGALHAAAPPVWLPYTLVDQVRAELAAHRHSAAYAELHRQLDGRLLTYQQTVQRVSRDMAAVR